MHIQPASLSKVEQHPLFRGLMPEQLQDILHSPNTRCRVFGRGSFVLTAGDRADYIGIVLQGSAQVIQEDYSGNRTIISSLEPMDLFGEAFVCAEIPQMPVSVYVPASAEILLLHKHHLAQLPKKNVAASLLLRNLLRIVASKNVMLNQKLRCVSQKSTADKLLFYLQEQARLHRSNHFHIPFDRQALADYLGVERSAMSAEISKLKRAGVLDTHKNEFTLFR